MFKAVWLGMAKLLAIIMVVAIASCATTSHVQRKHKRHSVRSVSTSYNASDWIDGYRQGWTDNKPQPTPSPTPRKPQDF